MENEQKLYTDSEMTEQYEKGRRYGKKEILEQQLESYFGITKEEASKRGNYFMSLLGRNMSKSPNDFPLLNLLAKFIRVPGYHLYELYVFEEGTRRSLGFYINDIPPLEWTNYFLTCDVCLSKLKQQMKNFSLLPHDYSSTSGMRYVAYHGFFFENEIEHVILKHYQNNHCCFATPFSLYQAQHIYHCQPEDLLPYHKGEGIIYGIYYQDKLVYIGQTKDFNQRKKQHLQGLTSGTTKPYTFMRADGITAEALSMEILSIVPLEKLNEEETFFINAFKPKYNTAKNPEPPQELSPNLHLSTQDYQKLTKAATAQNLTTEQLTQQLITKTVQDLEIEKK